MTHVSEQIRDQLAPHRIGILGFGLEGRSTLAFLRDMFPDRTILVADREAEGMAGLSGLSGLPGFTGFVGFTLWVAALFFAWPLLFLPILSAALPRSALAPGLSGLPLLLPLAAAFAFLTCPGAVALPAACRWVIAAAGVLLEPTMAAAPAPLLRWTSATDPAWAVPC